MIEALFGDATPTSDDGEVNTERQPSSEQTDGENKEQVPPSDRENKEQPADEVTIKVNGQERKVDLRAPDTVSLLQKGADYDRVKAQRDEAQAALKDSSSAVELIDLLAAQNGMDVAEYIEYGLANHASNVKAVELQALKEIYPDASEDLLEELATERAAKKTVDSNKVKEKKNQAKQEIQNRTWNEFLSEFPEITDIDSLPQSVKDAMSNGQNPIVAMLKHQRNEALASAQAEKKKQTIDNQNQKNQKQTIGSAASNTGVAISSNPWEAALFGG